MRQSHRLRRTTLLSLLICTAALTAAHAAQVSDLRLRQIGSVQLPGYPGFDHAVYANGNIVISHPGAHTVDVFNPQKRRIIGHVQGIGDSSGIAVDNATKTVFIADASKRSIAVVSANDWTVRKTIELPAAPEDIVFAEKENALYVSGLSEPVVMYVPVDGGQPASINVGGRIEGMALDPQTQRLFVSINDLAEIAVLQAAGAQTKVNEHWKLSASQPTGLALDPQVGRLFVAVRYAVLSLNANTGQEISRVPTAAGTDTLRYEPTGQTLYAASTDGTITVIAADKGTLVSQNEIRAEVKGHSFALDPQSHLLYLLGGREGKSKLVILKPYSTSPENDADSNDEAKDANGAPTTRATTPKRAANN